jgi:hypothetical protein
LSYRALRCLRTDRLFLKVVIPRVGGVSRLLMFGLRKMGVFGHAVLVAILLRLTVPRVALLEDTGIGIPQQRSVIDKHAPLKGRAPSNLYT